MGNASEGTHSNKNSRSIIGEAGLSQRLSVCPTTHTDDVQVNRNTHKLRCSNHPYRNVAKLTTLERILNC